MPYRMLSLPPPKFLWLCLVWGGGVLGFPGSTSGKEPMFANAGDLSDTGLIPGLGRSPGGGNGNLLQYSCLENPMDRGAWQVYSIKSQRVEHD